MGTGFEMTVWSDHHRFAHFYLEPFLHARKDILFLDASFRLGEKSRSWDDLPSQSYGNYLEVDEAMGGMDLEQNKKGFSAGIGKGIQKSPYGSFFLPVLYQSPILPQEIYVPPEVFRRDLYYTGGFALYRFGASHTRILWDMEMASSPRPEFKTLWLEQEFLELGSPNWKHSFLLQGSASGFNILNPREAGEVKLEPGFGVGAEYALEIYSRGKIFIGGGSSDRDHGLFHIGTELAFFPDWKIHVEGQVNSRAFSIADAWKTTSEEPVEIIQILQPGFEFYADLEYTYLSMVSVMVFVDKHESRPWDFGGKTGFRFNF